MRFMPNAHTGPPQFGPAARPPLEQLPADLVKLLGEHDRIAEQAQAARAHLAHLADDARDVQAEVADANAGAAAARAGKPIPPPVATKKLFDDRAEGLRAFNAQESAFTAVGQDVNAYLDDHRDTIRAAAEVDRKEARAHIEQLADELSTAIEQAVAAGAIVDWFHTHQMHTPASTWITDVLPDVARYGLDRANTTPYTARSFITGTVNAILEETTS